MGTEAENRESFHVQAGYCQAMEAPITARVCTALAEALDRTSGTGRRVLDWPGEPVADALVLRLVGGLHALHRRGLDAGLDAVFTGALTDANAVVHTLCRVVRDHDAALLPWLVERLPADMPNAASSGSTRPASLFTKFLDVVLGCRSGS